MKRAMAKILSKSSVEVGEFHVAIKKQIITT